MRHGVMWFVGGKRKCSLLFLDDQELGRNHKDLFSILCFDLNFCFSFLYMLLQEPWQALLHLVIVFPCNPETPSFTSPHNLQRHFFHYLKEPFGVWHVTIQHNKYWTFTIKITKFSNNMLIELKWILSTILVHSRGRLSKWSLWHISQIQIVLILVLYLTQHVRYF